MPLRALRRSVPVVAALLALLTLAVGAALAHETRDAARPDTAATAAAVGRLRALTRALAETRPTDELLTLAAERRALLEALIDDDPRTVLDAAVADDVRTKLPAAVQGLVERQDEVEGELIVLHEDAPAGGRYRYFVRAVAERVSLHFAGDGPVLMTGTRVRARGLRVNGLMALEGGDVSVAALATPSAGPNTFGAQRTLVLLVTFASNPEQPYTVTAMRNLVFTTTSNYFREASYGQTWLEGQVYGWFTVNVSDPCDIFAVRDAADRAAVSAGVSLASYARRVYIMPPQACPWTGMGSIGGAPSMSWINGTPTYGVIGHELGHNLGLFHSNGMAWSQPLGCATCMVAYGDTLDIMGSGPGHFNAFQKERLGWLAYGISPPITLVTAPGLYTLEPYETPGANPKALKILQNASPAAYLYVEFRRPIGFDASFATATNILHGVVVHYAQPVASASFLIDLTPATSSFWDPALVVGTTLHDKVTNVRITPLWVDQFSAGVQVSYTTVTAAPADLAVTAVSNPPATSVPRGRFTVTDTATNRGTGSARSSRMRYYLSTDTVKGTGDILLSGSRSVGTLAPGAESTGTTTVYLPAVVPPGSYRLLACADDLKNVAESDETDNCLGSATSVTVGAPDLVVNVVSTTTSTVAPGGRFVVAHTALNQGDASAGASRTRFYLSADTVKGTGDILLSGSLSITALAPSATGGGSVTVIVPSTTPRRTYRLLACADDYSSLLERDETNNCRATAALITVGP